MDGLRIPSRPNSDRGAPGPGLGVTVTAAAPDAASCSRTDALLRDDTETINTNIKHHFSFQPRRTTKKAWM